MNAVPSTPYHASDLINARLAKEIVTRLPNTPRRADLGNLDLPMRFGFVFRDCP